ncbi:KH domain-containing, RNA-binding, signal transduction-associated protein 2 [Glossina fuscipes]|uniref:KH domain-containing, RNA-binding, signal transduction-associated protein 2 n=1 Tax=Glossina fuscipes TaxID=7396 RepID=A0A9C6DX92_9MUSC|nr:KH domain-containing, RNA-binding, signal transduction-associated protein 2 [Glossina fuscipes]KAI9577704.1 hypothetical protein GQX74_010891 [Glossina fuscipes]
MTDNYDDNGDYPNYTEDDDYGKQRKTGVGPGGSNSQLVSSHNGDNSANHGLNVNMATSDNNHLNEKANEYIRDCLSEKARMERKFPIAEKLLDSEIEKVQTTGRIPSREQKYADIYREKPLRVSQKVLVPIREHPKFNFVGKLLGPKGNSLRRLQEETLCKMTVLGRNSMRDRVKEEELRNSKDPKYAHLNSDLHVEISTVAPPAEAYARIAYAMAELRKYLIPDSNDVIRQEQLRELMDNAHISDETKSTTPYKKLPTHHAGVGNVSLATASGSGGMTATSTAGAQVKNMSLSTASYRSNAQQQQQANNTFNKNNVAPKQKVMSILEKARSAMEETYGRGFETDSVTYDQSHTYDSYNYVSAAGAAAGPPTVHNHNIPPHTTQAPTGIGTGALNSRTPYENTDYSELDYNRRDYYQHSPSYGTSGIQSNQNNALNPNRGHVNR